MSWLDRELATAADFSGSGDVERSTSLGVEFPGVLDGVSTRFNFSTIYSSHSSIHHSPKMANFQSLSAAQLEYFLVELVAGCSSVHMI